MNKELTNYLFEIKENRGFHTPLSLETEITNAIAAGNSAEIKSIFKSNYEGELGILSFDKDRQNRYMFVTMSAIFSRAAVRGGLNYELACSMADTYCQKMDKLVNADDYMKLGAEMALDFCNQVKKTKKLIYSPIVNTCCEYVHNHTHEHISLDILSELTGMSTRRLSQRFKRETGTNIVDYIQTAKIDEAKILLTYTSKSIGEISSFLDFSSQSYFTQIFKKHEGYTPLEYQKMLQRNK